MYRYIATVISFLAAAVGFHENFIQAQPAPANNCIQFSVAAGTGCDWMCNYCANQLGTFNYYFPDNVCTYQTGGCVGNPIAGKTYSCCSV